MGRYIVSSQNVSVSLAKLRKQWIHPHFAAYLCLKWTAARVGKTTSLHPNFKVFFDLFLKVHDAPKDKPYLRIFLDEIASQSNMWLNKNVAGSFAPSSLRKTLLEVVKITGKGKEARYSLLPRHWELARLYLTRGEYIPIVDLATVLYRDYAILSESPNLSDIVQVFRDEFGYGSSRVEEDEFDHLYFDGSKQHSDEEWFEVLK